ncbi:hypothetical protein [Thiothrix sp.]|jgi:hypothetical protein|uniref:hypothetical protein n=1 Tax=Thiothrix sp. TaxID=1032 RepID=UPI00257F0FE6|nr:hypothetical protein [Thiothrix sp.]
MSVNLIKNEYLIIVSHKIDHSIYSLCKEKKDILNIIDGSNLLAVMDGFIVYENDKYLVDFKIVDNKDIKERLFFVDILCDYQQDANWINSTTCENFPEVNEEKLKRFSELADIIEDLFNTKNQSGKQAKAKIETLWNGLSYHLSIRAYELIHTVENMMRKFITYYMYTKVGDNWIEELPNDNDIKNIKKDSSITNKLYEFYLLDLGKFLYSKYGHRDSIDNLVKFLHGKEDIKAEQVFHYIPKSNLEKFFPTFGGNISFEVVWKRINDTRNIVAHNKVVTYAEYKDLCKNVKIIIDYICKSYSEMESISLDLEQQSEITDSLIKGSDPEMSNIEKEIQILKEISFDVEIDGASKGKGVIFDTNKSYDEDAIWQMLDSNIVAAYGDAKYTIDYLDVGDVVFFYHKGYGIIGGGNILSERLIDEDCDSYYRKVKFFTIKPTKDNLHLVSIPAREIRSFMGKNFYWARTVKVPYLYGGEIVRLADYVKQKLGVYEGESVSEESVK